LYGAPQGQQQQQQGEGGEQWIQVGDEVNGYYWVPAPPVEGAPTEEQKAPAVTATETKPAEEKAKEVATDSNEKKSEAASQAAAPAVAEQQPTKELTPEEQAQKQYMVWQTYYASNGYPYYYDDYGRAIYYDPSHYDAATLAQLQAKVTPPATTGQQPVDYYQYYSQVPVNRTDSDYFSHFQGYSDGQQQQK